MRAAGRGEAGGRSAPIASVARNVSRNDVPTLIRVLERPAVLEPVSANCKSRYPIRRFPRWTEPGGPPIPTRPIQSWRRCALRASQRWRPEISEGDPAAHRAGLPELGPCSSAGRSLNEGVNSLINKALICRRQH